jgi:hypothetical protein
MAALLLTTNLPLSLTVAALPDDIYAQCMGRWLFSASWAAGQRPFTGFIPETYAVNDLNAEPQHIAALLDVGLWERVEGGYLLGQGVEDERYALWQVDQSIARKPIPAELRQAVYDRDGWACLRCGSRDHLSLDHVHPYSLGGPDTLENLQTLCRSCNSRKGARVE